VRNTFKVPVTTDVHEPQQCAEVAEVVDILQIPAFLCRQSDLLYAAAETGKPVNVKKGQFIAPDDMKYVVEKIQSFWYVNKNQIILTERGTCFGYNDLIFDLRSILIMRAFGVPVCADVTHSTQKMGGGKQSGGDSRLAPYLARAAITCGVDMIFAEVHDNPSQAPSDGECQIPLAHLESFLKTCLATRSVPQWEDLW
jgi:2-dehydro-3-deoxyphosphooctonate aldolase (KDO 8-P synthase)